MVVRDPVGAVIATAGAVGLAASGVAVDAGPAVDVTLFAVVGVEETTGAAGFAAAGVATSTPKPTGARTSTGVKAAVEAAGVAARGTTRAAAAAEAESVVIERTPLPGSAGEVGQRVAAEALGEVVGSNTKMSSSSDAWA